MVCFPVLALFIIDPTFLCGKTFSPRPVDLTLILQQQDMKTAYAIVITVITAVSAWSWAMPKQALSHWVWMPKMPQFIDDLDDPDGFGDRQAVAP